MDYVHCSQMVRVIHNLMEVDHCKSSLRNTSELISRFVGANRLFDKKRKEHPGRKRVGAALKTYEDEQSNKMMEDLKKEFKRTGHSWPPNYSRMSGKEPKVYKPELYEEDDDMPSDED